MSVERLCIGSDIKKRRYEKTKSKNVDLIGIRAQRADDQIYLTDKQIR